VCFIFIFRSAVYYTACTSLSIYFAYLVKLPLNIFSRLVSGEVLKRQLIPSFIPYETNHVIVHRGDTAILRCRIRNL